jgi:photosystem II stability/assembly factor-like uncharacterized protein
MKRIGFHSLSEQLFLAVWAIMFLFFLVSCQSKITPTYEENLQYEGLRLRKIQFVNPDTGYAVGGIIFKEGMLFKTTDGGKNWQKQAEPTFGQSFAGLDFINPQQGVIGAWGGYMYRTEDAANTWQSGYLFRWSPINAFDYVNDTLIVGVTGEGYAPGFIHRWTTAKGWIMQDTMPFAMRDVVFVSPNIGFACGFGAIIKTIDAGVSWTYTPAKNEFFTAMSFPSSNVGYAVGRTGTIIKTTDAGLHWKILRNGNSVGNVRLHFNDVAFLDEKRGYIVGDNGLIWKTVDGGDSWKKFEKFNKANLFSIFLFGEGNGFLCGDEGLIAKFAE